MITTRKASLKDAEGIAKVLKGVYNISSVKEGKEAFKFERKEGRNYLVAIKDGKIVGLTTWLFHGLPKHGLIELDRIAVLDEYRRNGIATKLTYGLIADAKKELKKYHKNLRKLFLLSHKSNRRAHKFYYKLGFKLEAKFPNHFHKGETEDLLAKYFD